ncbi:hypothetical protein EIN_359160 [Entamoeba invadens IP1]|uniref:Uncharacterized protein n=1 Tax=Entamoeba invadens IP1 TaxID=370355 RepID=A0A0A1U7K2_ENTIV|nr:hypothetical protein EIN_359160 [Entamoeba invadens IP1]ELP90833.1 hypothetical protein EIN_359160 [Entamoeba invadens IP1]|eukprot:XP_004257604.1 hypothetical protein EIN_359160 [Entamoeba invadens IP1]
MPMSAFDHRVILLTISPNVFLYKDTPTIPQTPTKTYSHKHIDQAKRNSKNRDAFQQSFLLGMLVKCGYNVYVNKLYKKGSITHQMFTVNIVQKNETTVFNANSLIFQYDSLKQKRQYLDALTNNTILNLLTQNGCVIEERKTRKVCKNNSILMKRVNSIKYRDETFDQKQIIKLGAFLNQKIRERTSTKEGVMIKAFDTNFVCLLDRTCTL